MPADAANSVGTPTDASSSAYVDRGPDRTTRVRKDVQDLSPGERRQFIDAVLALKRRCSPYVSGSTFDPPPGSARQCVTSEGTSRASGISWYDQFVLWHRELSRCRPGEPQMNGHNGPLFLPWHREFLLLFEDALREVSGTDVTVPYWDTSNQGSTESTFAADFMGGNGDPNEGWALREGPFSATDWNDFPIRNEGLFWGSSDTGHITRNMGSLGGPKTEKTATDSAADIEAALRAERYDSAPYDDSSDDSISFRNALEGWQGSPYVDPADPKAPEGSNPIDMGPSRAYCSPDGWIVVPLRRGITHNRAHTYIGGVIGRTPSGASALGTMAAVPASPNDPLFFLLHANVDRLWALWQEKNQGPETGGFPKDSLNPWDAPDAAMHPFVEDRIEVTPNDVWDMNQLGYRYAHPKWTRIQEGSDVEPTVGRTQGGFLCRMRGVRA